MNIESVEKNAHKKIFFSSVFSAQHSKKPKNFDSKRLVTILVVSAAAMLFILSLAYSLAMKKSKGKQIIVFRNSFQHHPNLPVRIFCENELKSFTS